MEVMVSHRIILVVVMYEMTLGGCCNKVNYRWALTQADCIYVLIYDVD